MILATFFLPTGFFGLFLFLREGCKKKRPVFIVFYYEGGRTPPPFIVTWDSEIFGPYFNVVVDAIGPEMDFTLETNVKE